jgi:hypothetical protein
MRARSLSNVGNGVDFIDWTTEVSSLVHRLWTTTDWPTRLLAVQEASRCLIELIASMSDDEVRKCCFLNGKEGTKEGTNEQTNEGTKEGASKGTNKGVKELPCTMTYMPGAMWQIRLPVPKVLVQINDQEFNLSELIGIRLHVFEESAETVPHNHGIPFFSVVLNGSYVQTLWQQTNQSLAAVDETAPAPHEAMRPRRPPLLPSAGKKDSFGFVAVKRPFLLSRPRDLVKTDEHGVSPQQPPAPTTKGRETVLGNIQLQKSFFHTHSTGSVYFIGPKWIHTVDTCGSSLQKKMPGLNVPRSEPPKRVMTLVFRLPTYFGAQDHAIFYIPKDCLCGGSEECSCRCLNQTVGEEEGQAAINAAAAVAVRNTYGVSKEGTEEASAVMQECRLVCQAFTQAYH